MKYLSADGGNIMPRYYGTVMITLHGWFDADGIEEIIEYPMGTASNCTIETEIVDMEEESDGEDEE